MQGGTRDFVLLRTAIAIACAALIAMFAAPAALAGSPAGDQYGSAIPGGGNGGNTSGSGPSGGSETTIPVAPNSSSGTQATGGSGGTNANASGSGSGSDSAHGNGGKGGSSQGTHKGDSTSGGTHSGPGSVNVNNTAGHSVPQIAADSAGDSWLPFFIGGMAVLACAAAALVFFRSRRRTAQG
jgi:hypothetical protein